MCLHIPYIQDSVPYLMFELKIHLKKFQQILLHELSDSLPQRLPVL